MAFEQLGALHDTGFEGGPLAGLDDVRQQLQRPRPAGHAARGGIAEHVVRDPVELDALRHLLQSAREVRRQIGYRQAAGQGLCKLGPGRTQGTGLVAQLVPHPRLGRHGAAEQQLRRRRARQRFTVEGQGVWDCAWDCACKGPCDGGCAACVIGSGTRQGRRRSSVKGSSGLGTAGTTAIGPGVWPKRKKRARRRLSAV
jgi:hypothetical protein